MNRTLIGTCTGLLALASVSWPMAAQANYSITCESKSNSYHRCPLSQSGYVSLTRNLSKTDCVRGRNWDFDRREIWVDDGCRAQFTVNTSSYSDHGSHSSSSSDGAKVAGALIGLAVLGAAIHNSQHKDDDRYRDERYNDDNYYGSRHSSYMPGWMVGTFEGYNPQYNATIQLTIDSDGQARGTADSRAGSARINGWVSNQELHVGNSTFSINQTRDGFITSELGDSYNQVHYRRVR